MHNGRRPAFPSLTSSSNFLYIGTVDLIWWPYTTLAGDIPCPVVVFLHPSNLWPSVTQQWPIIIHVTCPCGRDHQMFHTFDRRPSWQSIYVDHDKFPVYVEDIHPHTFEWPWRRCVSLYDGLRSWHLSHRLTKFVMIFVIPVQYTAWIFLLVRFFFVCLHVMDEANLKPPSFHQ